jgi:hypothetical protein
VCADEIIAEDKDDSPALFMTRTGRKLSRREAYGIVCRVAAQANAHLPEEEKIDVSPHVLRHTFLRKLAEKKGVHYAREASGRDCLMPQLLELTIVVSIPLGPSVRASTSYKWAG